MFFLTLANIFSKDPAKCDGYAFTFLESCSILGNVSTIIKLTFLC